jgi:hypothetical protein
MKFLLSKADLPRPIDEIPVDQAGQLLGAGAGDQAQVGHLCVPCKKFLRIHVVSRHVLQLLFLLCALDMRTTAKRSLFILAQFSPAAMEFRWVSTFSAPCTGITAKKDNSTMRFDKDFTQKLPASPAPAAGGTEKPARQKLPFRLFVTARPLLSVHPRGWSFPTSRRDPRGPCGRRRPAGGRWACAGRDRG